MYEDGAAITIFVLENDSVWPDTWQTLTITQVTQSSDNGGSVEITSDNLAVVFTPTKFFHGLTNFTYTINDGDGGSATSSVTVNVIHGMSCRYCRNPYLYIILFFSSHSASDGPE